VGYPGSARLWKYPSSSSISENLRRVAPSITKAWTGLNTIAQPTFPTLSRAIGTAKHSAAVFNSVPDNFAVAMLAFGCDHMDRTLEAVEDVRLSSEADLECLIVFVSAMFTLRHRVLLLSYISFGWISFIENAIIN
jgi:hypothetical protein